MARAIRVAFILSILCVSCVVTGRKLSNEQLRIQRWFAQLTYLQPSDDFSGWGDAVQDVNCDGNTCIRYEISGLAYGMAALAGSTPAYQQVTKKILHDAILRMLDSVVWQYIDQFDDFMSQPTYPDPVAYKNIMYSGHLAQMMTLYESITGDFTFTTDGWDFMYKDYDPIHYTLPKLLDRILNQSLTYGNGGVPCEPDSIFIICNNYPQNAFLLHDVTHGTKYSSVSLPLWQDTVERHGIILPHQQLLEWDSTFFKLDYLVRPGIWEPLASVGSDAWALAWMPLWLHNETLLVSAFTSLSQSDQWVITSDEAYLHATEHSNALFPFSDEIATSFYPMISHQFTEHDPRLPLVNRYFSKYRRTIDSDGDGVLDSEMYNTNLEGNDVGDYSVWVTANLLMGEVGMKNIANMFVSPFYETYRDKPLLASVEYPHVMVAMAEWNAANNLVASIVAGDNPPPSRHAVILRNIFSDSVHIRVNNEEYHDFQMMRNGCIEVSLPGWADNVSLVYNIVVYA